MSRKVKKAISVSPLSPLSQTIFPVVNIRRLRLWEEYFLAFDPTHMAQQGQAEEHSMTHTVSDGPKVNYILHQSVVY